MRRWRCASLPRNSRRWTGPVLSPTRKPRQPTRSSLFCIYQSAAWSTSAGWASKGPDGTAVQQTRSLSRLSCRGRPLAPSRVYTIREPIASYHVTRGPCKLDHLSLTRVPCKLEHLVLAHRAQPRDEPFRHSLRTAFHLIGWGCACRLRHCVVWCGCSEGAPLAGCEPTGEGRTQHRWGMESIARGSVDLHIASCCMCHHCCPRRRRRVLSRH
jgi:hypothetical protein